MSFVKEFTRLQKQAYKISAAHGFHDSDSDFLTDYGNAEVSQRLMLAVSELAEAQEAMRRGNPPDSHISQFTGLEAEMADAVIRLMDLAEVTGSRLAAAIVAKMAYNRKRPMRHGGKKF